MIAEAQQHPTTVMMIVHDSSRKKESEKLSDSKLAYSP